MFWKKPNKESDIEKLKQSIRKLVNTSLELYRNNELLASILNFEIVYVTDIETDTIIWVNRQLEKDFGSDIIGKKCYEVFQGKGKKCDFCTNEIIKKQPWKPYKWIFFNKQLKKWFLINDIMIRHRMNGEARDIRIEQAIELDESLLKMFKEKGLCDE